MLVTFFNYTIHSAFIEYMYIDMGIKIVRVIANVQRFNAVYNVER